LSQSVFSWLWLSQSVFTLTPYCCMHSREAANDNFTVFGLTRPGIEPTIYHTQGKYSKHYITDALVWPDQG
jgi:hypothetical protein